MSLVLELKGITKAFPGVLANDAIDQAIAGSGGLRDPSLWARAQEYPSLVG